MNLIPPPPPASASALPAGTELVAGMGLSTVLPEIDFETYSEAGYVWLDDEGKWIGPHGAPKGKKGLQVIGTDTYAEHPSTEILCLSYDLKDGLGERFWRPGLPLPADLFAHIQAGGLLEAHNVMFERMIWHHVCRKRMGWPEVRPEQWRCSMAKARAFALPGALGEAGRVLNLPLQKDKDGGRLLDKFSKPRKPTVNDARRRIRPLWQDPAHGLTPDYAAVHPVAPAAPGATPAQQKTVQAREARAVAKRVQIAREDHEDALKLGGYNITDIKAEAELSSRCPDLTGEELAWWQVDQECNFRGIAVDVPGLKAAAHIVDRVTERYGAELLVLTGIDSASKAEQIIGWLHGQGLHLENLDEEAVDGALALPNLAPNVRRVLEIRAACASASVKKTYAMLNQVSSDGRLRNLYVYHGARTGRDTGEGPQPTNLPSAGPDLFKCASCGWHFGARHVSCPFCQAFIRPGQTPIEWNPTAAEQAVQMIGLRSLEWLEHLYGSALHVIAGCLRAMYVADQGRDLISTDYNSIEAVGLAMISGEKWRVDTFRTHGAIYEASAAMMFKVPFEEFMRARGYTDEELAQPEWWTRKPANRTGKHHPLRKKGKIGELAFGYQGWVGAAAAFGMPGTEDEIKADILAWRAASPAVVELWGGQERRMGWDRWPELYGVEGAVVAALTEPGKRFPVMRLDGTDTRISYVFRGDVLYCQLPSGRYLHYHRPRLEPSDRGRGGWSISYEGWNTNPKNGPKGWIRMRTWGGRLVENLIQAICRDILRWACIRLEQANYPVVMRTYDEIVSEIAENWGSISEFERIVTVPPPWASDWPIRAPDGWRGKRYRK